MSSSYKIAGVFVGADPIRHEWESVLIPVLNSQGYGRQSRFRDAIIKFPVLTTSQYAEWAAICDDNSLHVLFMPRRSDAVYATGPDTFSTTFNPFSTHYRLHFLGSRHSTGVFIYDTEILIYMAKTYVIGGGGG